MRVGDRRMALFPLKNRVSLLTAPLGMVLAILFRHGGTVSSRLAFRPKIRWRSRRGPVPIGHPTRRGNQLDSEQLGACPRRAATDVCLGKNRRRLGTGSRSRRGGDTVRPSGITPRSGGRVRTGVLPVRLAGVSSR